MNSAALLVEKGSLEMDAQDRRAWFLRFALLSDEPGVSLDGTKSLVRAGGYGGGNERRGAIFRDLTGDGAQRGVSALHDVVAAGAMDMHVNKSGNGCLVGRANFLRPGGQSHPRARPHGLNHAFANQDARIVNFCCRSERAADGHEKGRHSSTIIVTAILRGTNQNGRPRLIEAPMLKN